ncbi:MAG: acyl carrier protein [Pseudonocardia sp.]|nr:acyl carrier protein [Pseudonocardia sp.]
MTAATTTEEITTSVIEIVAEVLGADAAELSPGTDLRTVEGADSIKVLRIIARIEQRYDIELDDAEVFGVSTVEQVATVVAAAVGS